MSVFGTNKFIKAMGIGCLAVYALPAVAGELIFTYWTDAAAPFAIRSESALSGGIIKDIGDELSTRAALKPTYKELPTKRVAHELRGGSVHVTCLTNPKWQERPDDYAWSPVLFKGTDNFLVRKDNKDSIKSTSDLEGKTIGTYNGYVYREDIMLLFEQNKAERIQVPSFDIGMKMVGLGRIDTLIDFGSIIEYEIKRQGLSDQLTIASAHADEFNLYCKYSPKIPYDITLLNGHLDVMKKEGFFEMVLQRYR